jgi:predicted RNA-binding Zn-ribbon protein involved in translation (DUF1610 family)
MSTRDTHRKEQAPVNSCPRCERPMKFIKSISKLGPSHPELQVFICPECGEVETKEVERAPSAS